MFLRGIKQQPVTVVIPATPQANAHRSVPHTAHEKVHTSIPVKTRCNKCFRLLFPPPISPGFAHPSFVVVSVGVLFGSQTPQLCASVSVKFASTALKREAYTCKHGFERTNTNNTNTAEPCRLWGGHLHLAYYSSNPFLLGLSRHPPGKRAG